MISRTNIVKKYEKIFNPSSIAVIGASEDKEKIGGFILSNIIQIKNIKVFPINPKHDYVQGVKSYKNVKDINENVDLSIIIIKAEFVLQAFYDCVEKNIKNVIIISSGFKEIGSAGLEREKTLIQVAKENNINLIGPNCLGILNAQLNLNCSFAKDIPLPGSIALISQSGAVIDGIIDWSFKHKLGFSKIISLGNMAGFDELEALEYLSKDPETETIVFYMETLQKGKEFGKLLKKVSEKKPVIIIKPGNSDIAKKAIGSHTGSLAQDNILIKTLIEENNGIYVETLLDLFNQILITKAKRPKNQNTIILTNAGGPGVITTDALSKTKLNLHKLTDSEKERFSFLPLEASLNNPIDILGDAKSDRYIKTLDVLNKINSLSNILILLTPQIMTDSVTIAEKISEFSKTSNKTILTSFIGQKEIQPALEVLDNDIANFQTPSEAIKALNKYYKYNSFNYKGPKSNKKLLPKKIVDISNKKGLLDFETSKQIFESIGLKLPEKNIFSTSKEALQYKLNSKKQYVLKIDSKDVIHKKDVGGVLTNINIKNYEENINQIFKTATNLTRDFKITLEEQISGIETIIGLKQDEELGNFIMFGAGGTNVSLFKDINFSTTPLTEESAKKLITKSKIYPLLEGYRGDKGVNLDKLIKTLVKLSYLQEVYPQIKELDINPVMLNSENISFVDIKILL